MFLLHLFNKAKSIKLVGFVNLPKKIYKIWLKYKNLKNRKKFQVCDYFEKLPLDIGKKLKKVIWLKNKLATGKISLVFQFNILLNHRLAFGKKAFFAERNGAATIYILRG